MARNFRTARLMHNLKVIEAAQELGVSQPTLSAWETGRKAPGLESLEKMADFYGVTTDYLLGRAAAGVLNPVDPIVRQALPAFHGRPVWSVEHGWMLVDADKQRMALPDCSFISFENVGKVFAAPPPFADTDPPHGRPLALDMVMACGLVWVEPVSPDRALREELRGWYTRRSHWVENDCGNRFFLGSYGVKWLAFESPI
ncbi:helix-turn-helix transcriptional regulator [Oscillospiraceae bacterium 21-37]